MNFTDSYFYLVSNEILIKILEKLNTYDLLQFCKAYNADECLNVRALVRKINLSKCYNLRNLEPIEKINPSYIKTVNINGLYWLEENDLRSFLYRLENLENLFALDTALELKGSDLFMYQHLKLKKLAITVRKGKVYTIVSLPTIETLFIKFFKYLQISPYTIFPHLKVLWSEDTECCGNIEWKDADVKKSMHKTFYADLRTIIVNEYESRRPYQRNTIWFDRINLSEVIENVWPEEWKIFKKLHPYPFRTLYTLKEKNIGDIMLDELNLSRRRKCSMRYLDAIKKILSSPNTKCLKKLAINTCCLQHILCLEGGKQKQQEQNVSFCSLDRYSLQNLKNLEVLEMYKCRCTQLSIDFFNNFPIISQLKRLKYLVLNLNEYQIHNGGFLIDILNNCQELEALKITSTCTDNGELNNALCKALKNANNLKDFKYKNCSIMPITRILSAFCSIKKPKLERLSLICDESEQWEKSDYQILQRFLSKNSQLFFICFILENCFSITQNLITSTFIQYKKRHPAKYFIVTKSSSPDYEFIPDVHFREMITDTNIVSNPDIYQEVDYF